MSEYLFIFCLGAVFCLELVLLCVDARLIFWRKEWLSLYRKPGMSLALTWLGLLIIYTACDGLHVHQNWPIQLIKLHFILVCLSSAVRNLLNPDWRTGIAFKKLLIHEQHKRNRGNIPALFRARVPSNAVTWFLLSAEMIGPWLLLNPKTVWLGAGLLWTTNMLGICFFDVSTLPLYLSCVPLLFLPQAASTHFLEWAMNGGIEAFAVNGFIVFFLIYACVVPIRNFSPYLAQVSLRVHRVLEFFGAFHEWSIFAKGDWINSMRWETRIWLKNGRYLTLDYDNFRQKIQRETMVGLPHFYPCLREGYLDFAIRKYQALGHVVWKAQLVQLHFRRPPKPDFWKWFDAAPPVRWTEILVAEKITARPIAPSREQEPPQESFASA